MPVRFPSVERADEHGIVAISNDITPEMIKTAYKQGIFPWPINCNSPIPWFSPDPRGVLLTEDLHISKSLKKIIKKLSYKVTFNQDFVSVIHNCALIKRKQEVGTWITPHIYNTYIELFRQGHAFSVEVWENEDLAGGLYGVCIGEIISGESMFHKKSNTSKIALVKLVEKLAENNIPFLDTQMVTPVVEALGGKEIARKDFITELSDLRVDVSRESIFK